MEVSIHNSISELNRTPELLRRFSIKQKLFPFQNWELPYCEKEILPELPGSPLLVYYLHGHGSVGHDNFLQTRISSEPLITFFEKRKQKAVLLMPQCEDGFQWVDVPWTTTEHTLPEKPSRYMSAALALFDAKVQEYHPEKIAGLGISMGGYGIWDMGCRRHFDLLGVMCGGADTACADRFLNTRICIYHGAKDEAVPVCRARNMSEALKQAGCSDFVYREFPDNGHNVWDAFFTDDFALNFLFGSPIRFSE